MPSEVIRCSDCGTPFKEVPTWLVTAKVRFTCTNCPRRPSRGVARFEPAPAPRAALAADPDADMEAVDVEIEDSEDEVELAGEDLDDAKDEKDV